MYLLKIKPEQMKKLYYLREERKRNNKKSSIVGIVRDAIDLYLKEHKEEYKKVRFRLPKSSEEKAQIMNG